MVRLSVPLRLIGLFLATAGLVSCGTTTTGGVAGAAVTPAFPTQVAAANGTVSIPHQPSRIVSLSPAATEDLYAVGAGGQVVAVDPYSTYPSQAPRTTLSGFQPNVEAIAGYRPDLVVISDDTNHIAAQLGRLQIPVLVEPAPANLDGAYAEIEQIAQATGHAGNARTVIAGVKQQVDAIVRSVPPPAKPLTVYHELDQNYYSANSNTFIGQMYTLLGLKNIADTGGGSSDYPQLSAEHIVAKNPDLIVLADTVCCGQTARTVEARAGWTNISAVKTHSILSVDDTIASEWGPRIVDFLRTIAGALQTLERQSR